MNEIQATSPLADCQFMSAGKRLFTQLTYRESLSDVVTLLEKTPLAIDFFSAKHTLEDDMVF